MQNLPAPSNSTFEQISELLEEVIMEVRDAVADPNGHPVPLITSVLQPMTRQQPSKIQELTLIATIMGIFAWNLVRSSSEKKVLRKDLGDKVEQVAKIEGELSGEKLAAANTLTPEFLEIREERDDLRKQLRQQTVTLSTIQSDIALSPGLQVGSEGRGKTSYGSAGIFLTDQKGAIFLAAPAYVIGSRKGKEVEMKG